MKRLAALAFLLLCGCGPTKVAEKSDFVLKGEVFVVTKASQNIRLGRLEIAVYESGIVIHVQAKQDEAKVLIDKMRKAQIENTENIGKVRETTRGFEGRYNSDNHTAEAEGARAILKSAEEAIETITTANKELEGKVAYLQSAQYCFDTLPKPGWSVKTDSEGKYQITLPKHKHFLLAAKGSYNSDSLYWLIIAPEPKDDVAELTLSNDNWLQRKKGVPLP